MSTLLDDNRYREVKNPVALTWLISFKQIRLGDPLAADYLSFMACVDPKDVPQSLLPSGPSRRMEMSAIGTLKAYSFIQTRAEGLDLDAHRLVHLATRNWLRKEELLVQWTKKAVERLADVIPNNENQDRSAWRRYLVHARYALDSRLIDQDAKERIDLAWKVGNCLDSDGRWKEAETLIIQVTNFRIRVLGKEHPDTLTSMNNLAGLYESQGKCEAAKALYEETLQLRKKILGLEHPQTLGSINKLARLYESQGKYEAADKPPFDQEYNLP